MTAVFFRYLIAVSTFLLVFGVFEIFGTDVFAAVPGVIGCPPGSHVRGLECCSVVHNRVSCRRNDEIYENRFSSRLGSLIKLPARAQLAEIDDADLKQLTKTLDDYATVGDASDICATTDCSFDWIRALAHSAQNSTQCFVALNTYYCLRSMWKDLNVEQRLRRLLTLGKPYAEEYQIDVRALPCISARETAVLEPLTISDSNCGGYSSDEGLGQIIWPTYSEFVYKSSFRSQVSPVDPTEPGTEKDLRRRFDELGNSATKQIELMAYSLRNKLNETSGGAKTAPGSAAYQSAFANYNGSAAKNTYAALVNSCFVCMQKRVNPDTLEITGDPSRCLSAALGRGRDIHSDYDLVHSTCHAGDAK